MFCRVCKHCSGSCWGHLQSHWPKTGNRQQQYVGQTPLKNSRKYYIQQHILCVPLKTRCASFERIKFDNTVRYSTFFNFIQFSSVDVCMQKFRILDRKLKQKPFFIWLDLHEKGGPLSPSKLTTTKKVLRNMLNKLFTISYISMLLGWANAIKMPDQYKYKKKDFWIIQNV